MRSITSFLPARLGRAAAVAGLTVALSVGMVSTADAKSKPILAPGCVESSQFFHSGWTGTYTNVYLANTCKYPTRIKLVMRNGYDSGCISLARGASGVKFRSRSTVGFQPKLARLQQC